ncbi:hypothetical protein C0Q70_04467 [Pomacea canaliculata]|uniref:GAIN-B domain-containing protein n=1 Tax=Pomacea canaliculata TaxID=400727 RepID=A0A2T7PIF7_POMCA|nr:hypothetical protein C0Q70_04467 [Pomacea canaliculata]
MRSPGRLPNFLSGQEQSGDAQQFPEDPGVDDPECWRPGGWQRYLFTVTVSKKSQGASRFASTNVTVIALAGDPPRVQLNLFNGNRGRYSADEMVTLAAELTASSPVTVQWTSYESSDYGYVNLSDSAVVGAKQEPLLVDSATNAYVAFLTIRAGSNCMYPPLQCPEQRHHVPGAVSSDGSQSERDFRRLLYVRRGVTSCKFSIEGGSYTELGALRGKVEQCDTDQDGHPMTFDFFVLTEADTASVKRLTKPSSLGQLDIPYGPRAYLSGGNSFTVQVCAALGGCTWFNSSFVTVTPINSGSLTTIKTTIIKAAKDLRKSGNPLDGILSLATYLQSQLSSRSRRSAGIQTPDVNGLVLDFANDTLRTMYPSETVLKTLMDGLASVPPTSLSDDDLLRMLSIYEEIATGYGAADVPAMSPEQVGQIKRFENYLVSTRGLPTSQAEVDTDKGTLSYSVQALSSTELSRSSSSPVSLSFGDTLNKRYNRWSCGSSQCLGVGVEVFHYSTNTYPNPPPDSTLSADVVTLTLFDQNSGADISNISNLESPATLTFPLVQPKGAPYLCKYWEATSRTWRTEGVTTSLQTADTVVCTTTHLTDFTVVSARCTPLTVKVLVTDTHALGDGSSQTHVALSALCRFQQRFQQCCTHRWRGRRRPRRLVPHCHRRHRRILLQEAKPRGFDAQPETSAGDLQGGGKREHPEPSGPRAAGHRAADTCLRPLLPSTHTLPLPLTVAVDSRGCWLVITRSDWLVISPSDWLVIIRSDWLVITLSDWLVISPSDWLVITRSDWLVISPSDWLVISPSDWLVITLSDWLVISPSDRMMPALVSTCRSETRGSCCSILSRLPASLLNCEVY